MVGPGRIPIEEAIQELEEILDKLPSDNDVYADLALDEARAMNSKSISSDDWYTQTRESRAHAVAAIISERRISYYLSLVSEYKTKDK